MSSFTRTIRRSVKVCRDGDGHRTLVSRRAHFMGRGSKLGIRNPKDSCRTGAAKKPKPWRAKNKVADVDRKPKVPQSAIAQPRAIVLTKGGQREFHKLRMLERARKREKARNELLRANRFKDILGTPANINRRTGKPHRHQAEIARRKLGKA